MKTEEPGWTTVIQPKSSFLQLNLRELFQYKDLIMLFVWRDFVSLYKQTILGPLWYIIQPLFTTITFTIIFGHIARIPTGGIPPVLFYLSGLTLWNYFASCLIKTSNTFVANAGIFGKVYFPRLTVPISIVISNLLSFAIQFLLFILFVLYFALSGSGLIKPNLYFLMVPLLVLIMAGLGLGFGILISSLTTKYRDLAQLVNFGVQLLMYATPIIYPLSGIPDKYKLYLELNPMTSLIEAFRYGTIGSGSFSVPGIVYSFIFMVTLLLSAIILFNRVEKTFMDTV